MVVSLRRHRDRREFACFHHGCPAAPRLAQIGTNADPLRRSSDRRLWVGTCRSRRHGGRPSHDCSRCNAGVVWFCESAVAIPPRHSRTMLLRVFVARCIAPSRLPCGRVIVHDGDRIAPFSGNVNAPGAGRRSYFRLLEGRRPGAGSNLSGPMTAAIRPDAKLPAPCSSFHDRGAMGDTSRFP